MNADSGFMFLCNLSFEINFHFKDCLIVYQETDWMSEGRGEGCRVSF